VKLSAEGLQLIKQQEGFRSRTYLDVAGFPTIGYGHRVLHQDSYPNGVDEAQATEILASDVCDSEQAVGHLVTVSLTQGQFDALVDFCFNLGSARLASSTLLKLLNAGRYADAAEQLLRWDQAGGKECPGLKARREAELSLWNGVRQSVAA
jgi:GH24 family phage-related lysozyme (muramidase)